MISEGAKWILPETGNEPVGEWAAASRFSRHIGAIGPSAMWDLGHFILYRNFYHELGAANRPEGNKLALRVQWLPGNEASHGKAN